MKKNLITAAAIAIGVVAFTNLMTTANAGLLDAGLQNTAQAVQQDNVVTKAGWRRHRGWRRHGGWRSYRHCLWLQSQGYRIACNFR